MDVPALCVIAFCEVRQPFYCSICIKLLRENTIHHRSMACVCETGRLHGNHLDRPNYTCQQKFTSQVAGGVVNGSMHLHHQPSQFLFVSPLTNHVATLTDSYPGGP
jgi:hypothetical protein